MKLQLLSNSGTNPQQIDLTTYVMAGIEAGMDPASPSYSNRQFTTSLLKEGGVYTLENPKLKELMFPVLLGPVAGTGAGSSTATALLITQINQILQTPGATALWQDDGMSQPTYFGLATGQLDVQYDYRKAQQHYVMCKLRLFAQPFGTTAAPRVYAAASALGPLLMISPYGSNGALAIAASTQAGVAGFGGQQQGPSSGIFYGGTPTLAGDAPAIFQVSYAGPLPVGATQAGYVPQVVMALLPDQLYVPLVTASALRGTSATGTLTWVSSASAPGGAYARWPSLIDTPQFAFYPYAGGASVVPAIYAGNHRIFAIARASALLPGTNPVLQLLSGGAVTPQTRYASVTSWDWDLYDLGTISLRASEATPQVTVGMTVGSTTASQTSDLAAIVMVPDAASWMLQPAAISPSQYGWAPFFRGAGVPVGYYSNTILIDDTLPDQFIYAANTVGFTPSPAGMGASVGRITQYTRGIVPRSDPARGLPIIAFIGVNQQSVPTSTVLGVGNPLGLGQTSIFGARAWPNPAGVLPTFAQISVVERARYVLP